MKPTTVAQRALTWTLVWTLTVQPFVSAMAAGVQVAGSNTTLDNAGNGVPVVNIAQPNGAGVSHNTYQQFNVGKEGLILNNSTAQLTQTQLGGLIQNNSNLKGNAASSIINEVVSPNRSQLQGYMEVAGKSANVMVANPYGITCSGCGFLNTPNATLTTGKPQFDAQGRMNGLDVRSGDILVDGQGLDASQSDYFSLISRTSQVNAGIHAKDLKVIVGANHVAADGSVTALNDAGNNPAVAIDTGSLGGMYANRISLVASDKGVGVNLGNLAAREGDITLDVNGQLSLKDTSAKAGLQATAAAITLAGDQQANAMKMSSTGTLAIDHAALRANQGVELQANSIDITGGSLSADSLALAAAKKLSQDQSNTLKATNKISLQGNQLSLAGTSGAADIVLNAQQLATQESTTLQADNALRLNVANEADTRGTLTAGQSIDLNAGTLTQRGMVAAQQLAVDTTTFTNQGKMLADRQMKVSAQRLENSGTLLSGQDLTINSHTLNNSGSLLADGTLSLSGASAVNSGSMMGDQLSLTGDRLDNSGLIQAQQDLALKLNQDLNQSASGSLTAGNALRIDAAKADTDGNLQANALTWQGNSWHNGAKASLKGDASVSVAGQFLNDGSLFAGNQLLVDSDSLDSAGTLQAENIRTNVRQMTNLGTLLAGDLSSAGQMFSNSGVVEVSNTLALQAKQFTQSKDGKLQAGGGLTVNADEADSAGELQADTLNWQGNNWRNAADVSVLDASDITLSGALDNSGQLLANHRWDVSVGSLTNGGSLQGDEISLLAGDIANSGSLLANNIALTASELQNSGLLQGSDSLNLAVGKTFIQHEGGQLLAGNQLSVTSAKSDTAGEVQGNQISWQGNSWKNSGKVAALDSMQAELQAKIENQGQLQAINALKLQGPELTNSGLIQGQALTMIGLTLANTGSVLSDRLSASLNTLNNNGTLQADHDLSLTVAESLHQQQNGRLLAGEQLSVTAPDADTDGEITANTLDWQGTNWQNRARVTAKDSADSHLTQQLNNSGQLLAQNQWTISSPSFINSGILQAGDVAFAGENFTNNGTTTGLRSLTVNATQKIDNSGKLQGEGNSLLNAPTIVNTGSLLAKKVTLTGDRFDNDGTLLGQQGLELGLTQQITNRSAARLLSGSSASLNTGSFINQGSVQATGPLTLTLSQDFTNQGNLQGDGGLTLNAGNITNQGNITGGNVALTGASLNNSGIIQGKDGVNVEAGNSLVNQSSGQLLSTGSSVLHASSLRNDGWLQSGNLTINGNQLDQNNTLLATGVLVINTTRLNNQGITQGNIARWTGDTLSNDGTLLGLASLAMQANQIVNNTNGKLWGSNDLTFTTNSLQQNGQLLAMGNLTWTVKGPLTVNTAIAAGNSLTLHVDGDMNQQGTLQGNSVNITSGGTLTNRGKITSGNGASSLRAANIQLADSGSVQGGGSFNLTSSGELTNNGFVGTLGDLTLQAGSLLQNTSLLYAGSNLRIYADRITNLHGDVLAGNSLWMQRDAQGNTNSEILNRSGNIETRNGDITLNTAHLLNDRDGFAVTQQDAVLNSPSWANEVANYELGDLKYSYVNIPVSWLNPDDYGLYKYQVQQGHGHGDDLYRTEYRYAPYETADIQKVAIKSTSMIINPGGNASRISSGRNISGVTYDLENNASSILANGNIALRGDSLKNTSYTEGTTTEYQTFHYGAEGQYVTRPNTTSTYIKGKIDSITYVVSGAPEYETVGGTVYSAVIQAGGSINAAFNSDISNTSVRPNAGYATQLVNTPTISALNGAGTLKVQSTRQLVGNGEAILQNGVSDRQTINSADFTNPAAIKASELVQQQPVSVGNLRDQLSANFTTSKGNFTPAQLSDYPLPTGNSGLFVLDGDKSSRYLIRTNPQLDSLGQIDNSLFSQLQAMTGAKPASNATVETRSQYTNVDQFLGSSYLLDKLNLNADSDYRFLGDAAFDTRYISNAVLNQTGQRYLKGIGSDLDQMQYLMDNAASAQKSLNLTLGVSLNADQIAGLDHSIVWWESVTLDGQTVLAPKIYLAKADSGDLQGSAIVANSVNLSSSGAVTNSGAIKAVELLDINAGTLANQSNGLLKSDGSLNLTALSDITNTSATIQGNTVALNSVNGSVINKTDSMESSVSGKLLTDWWGKNDQTFTKTLLSQRAEISGNTVSISAGNNIVNQGATLKATQDLNLTAANDVVISANKVTESSSMDLGKRAGKASSSESTHWQGSEVSAGGAVNATAGHDLTVGASTIASGGALSLVAGNDLMLNAEQNLNASSSKNGKNSTSSSTTTVANSQLSSGGDMALRAGRDLTSEGTAIESKSELALNAGRDVNLNAAESDSNTERKGRQSHNITESVRQQGTELGSAGSTSIKAGRDINTAAATVNALGDLALQADRDINIGTAAESDYRFDEKTKVKKGMFSKTTTHTVKEDYATTQSASSLSGDNVTMVAGQNLGVTGSRVVGEGDVTLKAGKDLAIAAATEEQSSYRLTEKKTGGMFSGGGIGVTFGSKSMKQQLNLDGTTQSQSASAVGSTGGNVNLIAGGNAHIGGSDVIASQDLNVVGGSVTIDAGNDALTRKQIIEQKQSGLTLQLTSPVTDALLALGDTLKQSSDSGDDRLKALYAVKALESGWASATSTGTQSAVSSLAKGDLKDAGIQIQLSVGASKSKSTSQYSQNTVSGSTLNAGGNIAVVATGANGQSGDINVSGSGITGNNVTLAAQNNLNLVAARNDAEQKSSNKASGWNAGVHIAIGQETGIGVQANGYMMDGKENGNTTEYVNTRVNAKDMLTLSSGNDTVLSGAQALGNRIVADVGNNLTLTSLQDIDNYQSKQTSVSGGFSFTFGTMTGSANLSVSKSKTKSEYASVGDQSGLFAGDAGYDVYVGNHTQLNGAVIASTAGAANNALSTGTLGWSAIENAASYKASSYSAGGGFSVTEQKDDQGNVKKDKNGNSLKDTDASPTMPFAMSSSGSASGTTNSAISAGTITVRNGNAQQQHVSELSRDTDNANGSIGKIFDKDKVASDMELAKGITELAGQFSSDLSRNKVQDAKAEAENRLMLTSDKYRQATPAERASMLADDATYHEQIKTWGVGGTVPMAITAVTAAFSGITAGNLGAAASGAMAPYIARQIKAATGDNVIANAMAHAVEGAVLAQMAGNSATAGAIGSAGGELIARSIVATLYPGVEAQNLTEEQKHIVSALSQISSGILGGLEGNSVAAIATAQVAGKNAVENNDLSLPGGMMSSIDAAGSWNRYAEANGLTLEQKEAGLHKLATGDLPEGANIPKVIINGYKDGVLIAGAAYLGPAASIGKAVGGAIIAEIANGSYQWFDLNQPGNESKGWDYWGSASAGITGALAPGRGVWKNVGIAAGGAVFTDGPDVGAVGGAALGALAGGFFGELAPFPGEMNDLFGGIGGEIISNKFKDKVNDN